MLNHSDNLTELMKKSEEMTAYNSQARTVLEQLQDPDEEWDVFRLKEAWDFLLVVMKECHDGQIPATIVLMAQYAVKKKLKEQGVNV